MFQCFLHIMEENTGYMNNQKDTISANLTDTMSKTRKIYFARLFARCMVFAIILFMYVYMRDEFDIIKGLDSIRRFSPLHILWAVWIWDMVLQLIPVKAHISIGSQKQFSQLFRPIKEKINKKNLKKYM